MYALQSVYVGVGCLSGEILCRYSIYSRHLFALNCAKVPLVYLGSVCSCSFTVVLAGCHLLISCLSLFVSGSELLLCVCVSCCFPLFA